MASFYSAKLVGTLVFTPYVTDIVAVATLWGIILKPCGGAVNEVLELLGVANPPMRLQGLNSVPAELYESAELDGASRARIYSRIVMPLATQVLTVGLQSFQTEYAVESSLQMAGVCISLLPVLLVFVFVQDYFVEGIASTGLKG